MFASNFSGAPNLSESSTMLFYTSDKIARIVTSTIVFLVGLIGNILVIVVVKNKSFRSTNDCFIMNLAIADLCLVLELPWAYYLEFATLPFGTFYCKVIYCVGTFCLNLGVFTLTSMALERWYTFSFRSFQIDGLSQRTAILWIVLLWLSAFACVLPLVIVVKPGELFCDEQWPSHSHRKAYSTALVVIQYLLPLFLIAVCYIKIARCLINTSAGRGVMDKEGQMKIETNRRENITVIKTLAVIVVLFALLMLPLQISWMMLEFGSDDLQAMALEIMKYVPIPVYIHSCVNPLVYGTLRKQFRKAYARYLAQICWPCRKRCCKTEPKISRVSSMAVTWTNGDVTVMQGTLQGNWQANVNSASSYTLNY